MYEFDLWTYFNQEQVLYLELLARFLCRLGFTEYEEIERFSSTPGAALGPVAKQLVEAGQGPAVAWLASNDFVVAKRQEKDRETLAPLQIAWPGNAESMIGYEALLLVAYLLGQLSEEAVPGDFVETGVWRGGASIMARGAMKVMGDTFRKVWAADSFQGLPPPDPGKYPADEGDEHFLQPQLAVSLEEVRHNFKVYGLLDEQVEFLPGWFSDTLPKAAIEEICLLRLDGDMYSSTIEALEALYHKVSIGGFVVIDDYASVDGCAKAIGDFRAERGIFEPMVAFNNAAALWRKEENV